MPNNSPRRTGNQTIHWIAHRGYPVAYPENSILGIKEAISAGARFIEIDVQFSADNHPVIYHDPTLKRISGLTGRVNDYPLSQLLKMPAHDPEHFSSRFEDNTIDPLESILPILDLHPNLVIFFEIKRHSLDRVGRKVALEQLDAVLDSVRDQSVLISFDQPLIHTAIEQQSWQTGIVMNCQEQFEQFLRNHIDPEFIFLNHQFAETLDLTALRQYRLVAYEISDKPLADRLVEQGFHWLETDNIGLMGSYFDD